MERKANKYADGAIITKKRGVKDEDYTGTKSRNDEKISSLAG